MGEQLQLAEVAEMDRLAAEAAHAQFVDKFKPKLTTDDCYTPENVMDAVQTWVAKEYHRDRSAFIRPFWPGGDYQKTEYPDGCTVVDNPPFSILAKICTWYQDRGIPFFLFGPALTSCSARTVDVTYVCVGSNIVYENGAEVPTSFITNLDSCRLRTAPELYQAMEICNTQNKRIGKKELPKYVYPDHILTGKDYRLGKYGQTLRIRHQDCEAISQMDAQRTDGKSIFGGGLILSERAAAERAAAERAAATKWEISDREWAIIRKMGGGVCLTGRQPDPPGDQTDGQMKMSI